ncbi:hypothetical protein Pcac1_g12653 [Phytophthora cactorum]|nr:hypothetical protein Pcac1_g12653 [Phytophthora cactorum]
MSHARDEGASSSTADSQSVVDTHDPVTGSRQPREESPNSSILKILSIEEEEKPPTPVTPRSVSTERAP